MGRVGWGGGWGGGKVAESLEGIPVYGCLFIFFLIEKNFYCSESHIKHTVLTIFNCRVQRH